MDSEIREVYMSLPGIWRPGRADNRKPDGANDRTNLATGQSRQAETGWSRRPCGSGQSQQPETRQSRRPRESGNRWPDGVGKRKSNGVCNRMELTTGRIRPQERDGGATGWIRQPGTGWSRQLNGTDNGMVPEPFGDGTNRAEAGRIKWATIEMDRW